MAWYILLSFSLLFSSSVSHCANHLPTSLFFPPDKAETFMKLFLAVWKSFILRLACPWRYQAFSLSPSSSRTISASCLILSELEPGWSRRH